MLPRRFHDTNALAATVHLGLAERYRGKASECEALFVLAASVSGFSADDRQKNGLLMSMGLKNADCLWLNFYDWGITALIAATGAVAGTWIAGLLIYRAQFNLSYSPDTLWVAGVIVAMVATVCLVGYLACRQSLKVSVRDLMAA